MTSVICWSLVSPNQPWPPLAWAKAAGAKVSSAPTKSARAIVKRARRTAESVPLCQATGTPWGAATAATAEIRAGL